MHDPSHSPVSSNVSLLIAAAGEGREEAEGAGGQHLEAGRGETQHKIRRLEGQDEDDDGRGVSSFPPSRRHGSSGSFSFSFLFVY